MFGFLSKIFVKKMIYEGVDQVTDKGPAANWRIVALRFAAFGGTFAIVVVILLGLLFWYQSRPKPPQTWNTNAIVAKYNSTDIDPKNKTAYYLYTLENKTDFDYRFGTDSKVSIMLKHKRQHDLASGDELTFDKPIFIPSKHRISFAVHFKYPVFSEFSDKIDKKERELRDKIIHEFLNKEMPNLDGFILFDEETRYEIDLPKGW